MNFSASITILVEQLLLTFSVNAAGNLKTEFRGRCDVPGQAGFEKFRVTKLMSVQSCASGCWLVWTGLGFYHVKLLSSNGD